jgi:hypothetical protein
LGVRRIPTVANQFFAVMAGLPKRHAIPEFTEPEIVPYDDGWPGLSRLLKIYRKSGEETPFSPESVE